MRHAALDESHKLESDCREKYQQPQICNDTTLMKSMNSMKSHEIKKHLLLGRKAITNLNRR